jgi:RHS repeat-associated protein
VARERDNTAWEANAEAVSSWAIASRQLLLQNWRADVVRATDSLGTITDRIRYTAYGEPQRYSLFDVGRPSGNIPDGSFDYDDYVAFLESLAIGDASVDPAADVDHDGTIDGADYTAFMNAYASDDEGPLGTGHLSRELDVGFRRGYAGYEFDPVLGASSASIYHVRNRVYDAENGRWNRRDPLGYVDGMGLYEYVKSGAVDYKDPLGLALSGGCSGSACRGAELVGNNANARCRSGHVNLNQDLPIVTPPLPPSIPGPNRPEAFECERACSSVSALAINYCINGVLTICICPLLYLNYSASESFLSQYYPCLIAFETQTSLGLSCIPGKTGIPEIGTPNQGETPQQTLNRLVSSICNKASAYAALHECAKRIDCTKGSDASKRPWCEYHKCLEVYQTGCLARKLQALCENGRNRPYNQVQSEFSAAFSDCSLNNAPCFRPLR